MPTRSGKPTTTDKKNKKVKPKILVDSDDESDLSSVSPEPSTDLEPDTEPDQKDDNKSDTSSDDESPQIFAQDEDRDHKVVQFLVLGVFSGKTRNSVVNSLEDHGAVITDNKTCSKTSHIIMSDSVWHNHSSSQALRHYISTNAEEAEAYPDDPDRHRVWFLPLEWAIKSIEAKKLLPEEDYDYEKAEDGKRKKREEALADERRQNGGKSAYSRGERRRIETQKQRDALERELDAENATTDSDSSVASPVQTGRPGNPLAGYDYNTYLRQQSLLNQNFFGRTGQTLGGPVVYTGVGPLGSRQYSAGGAAGRLSGVGPAAVKSANSVNNRPAFSAADQMRGRAQPQAQPRPQPQPQPQPQPKSLGAIELSSGDDSVDVPARGPPPAKKQRLIGNPTGVAIAGEADEYDW